MTNKLKKDAHTQKITEKRTNKQIKGFLKYKQTEKTPTKGQTD